jgi:hypothetical protein
MKEAFMRRPKKSPKNSLSLVIRLLHPFRTHDAGILAGGSWATCPNMPILEQVTTLLEGGRIKLRARHPG